MLGIILSVHSDITIILYVSIMLDIILSVHSDITIILYVSIMLDIILSVIYLHTTYATFRELATPHISVTICHYIYT